MRILTHVADDARTHCAVCGLELPWVTRDAIAVQPQPAQRVGVIDGLRWSASASYFIGQTDTNPPCAAALAEVER